MKKSSALLFAGLLACLYAFTSPTVLIRSNLYITTPGGTPTIIDGDITQYDLSFSNNLDGLDARKMSNFAENIGLQRDAITLVIERRRTIQSTDTIFYKIWNLSPGTNYQLGFDPTNMAQPGLTAYVQDNYLHTNTPVSLETASSVNFSINADPASSDPCRFRLIFTTASGGPCQSP